MQAPSFTKWFARLPASNQPQRLQTPAPLHPAAGIDRVNVPIGQVRAPERLLLKDCCASQSHSSIARGVSALPERPRASVRRRA